MRVVEVDAVETADRQGQDELEEAEDETNQSSGDAAGGGEAFDPFRDGHGR